jgi:hypothetical protein
VRVTATMPRCRTRPRSPLLTLKSTRVGLSDGEVAGLGSDGDAIHLCCFPQRARAHAPDRPPGNSGDELEEAGVAPGERQRSDLLVGVVEVHLRGLLVHEAGRDLDPRFDSGSGQGEVHLGVVVDLDSRLTGGLAQTGEGDLDLVGARGQLDEAEGAGRKRDRGASCRS